MKHPNHFGRWLACVLLCLLLAGCSMPGEQVQVEELLRAPKLSGDYGDVQTALNDWLGESAQLKYPIQGELLSPFVLQDLDGDGRQDAAVLYTTAQTANVCVAILQRDDAGSWQVRQSVEGLAETGEISRLQQAFIDQLMSAGRWLLVLIVAWLLWRKGVRPQLQRRAEAEKAAREQMNTRQETEEAVEVRLSKDEQIQQRRANQRMGAEVMSQRIREMSDNDPRVVALVIRQWMGNEHE